MPVALQTALWMVAGAVVGGGWWESTGVAWFGAALGLLASCVVGFVRDGSAQSDGESRETMGSERGDIR